MILYLPTQFSPLLQIRFIDSTAKLFGSTLTGHSLSGLDYTCCQWIDCCFCDYGCRAFIFGNKSDNLWVSFAPSCAEMQVFTSMHKDICIWILTFVSMMLEICY